MLSPLNPDAKVIALAGDWHANLVVALEQIDRAHTAGSNLIIQLGDLGYGTPVTTTAAIWCGWSASSRLSV